MSTALTWLLLPIRWKCLTWSQTGLKSTSCTCSGRAGHQSHSTSVLAPELAQTPADSRDSTTVTLHDAPIGTSGSYNDSGTTQLRRRNKTMTPSRCLNYLLVEQLTSHVTKRANFPPFSTCRTSSLLFILFISMFKAYLFSQALQYNVWLLS